MDIDISHTTMLQVDQQPNRCKDQQKSLHNNLHIIKEMVELMHNATDFRTMAQPQSPVAKVYLRVENDCGSILLSFSQVNGKKGIVVIHRKETVSDLDEAG